MSKLRYTTEELDRERIPDGYRDDCVHLLVPLNRCRYHTFSLPWKCTAERHAYETCEYKLYLQRLKDSASDE